jgi:hypothetical protein
MCKHLEGKNGQVRENFVQKKNTVTDSGVTQMHFGRWVPVKIVVL